MPIVVAEAAVGSVERTLSICENEGKATELAEGALAG